MPGQRLHCLKIHVYTDIDTLFGRACRLWVDVLLAAGHDVEFIDLGMDTQDPLPDVGLADLNLLVVGIYAFARFGRHGLPRGKNILWMLDPLTRDPAAAVHGHKAALFDAFAPQLRRHHPAMAVSQLPYLIADKHIRPPQPEAARAGGVVFIGHPSSPREEAEVLFRQQSVPADFVWAGLWGRERERRVQQARIVLAIHADPEHTYFDQFRILEAWAAGTPVACETTGALALHGIHAGEHLAAAELASLPALCRTLQDDVEPREALAAAGQALLRREFSVARWRTQMLAAIDGLA